MADQPGNGWIYLGLVEYFLGLEGLRLGVIALILLQGDTHHSVKTAARSILTLASLFLDSNRILVLAGLFIPKRTCRYRYQPAVGYSLKFLSFHLGAVGTAPAGYGSGGGASLGCAVLQPDTAVECYTCSNRDWDCCN